MEFEGIRIMMRALNIKNIESIRSKIDKNKPLPLNINGENKNEDSLTVSYSPRSCRLFYSCNPDWSLT